MDQFLVIAGQFIPLLLVFVVFYFLLIRPEKKRKVEYDQMLTGLSLNDEVMTRGGIIGKIVQMDDENVVLESGPDRVKLKMVKNSIANKVYKEQ